MKTKRSFIANGNRYIFDFDICSTKKGFAQIDTEQDAWYYGVWVNPFTKTIVNYAEGDLTIQEAESDEEFVGALHHLRDATEAVGWKFYGIDPGADHDNPLAQEFKRLGVAHLLH